mmetsp:Transcript_45152/g.114298  ORF Transcript_45152/g.114298 Transcript_45152/m.114298 type:complete len:322 (-) Transcript_45152:93-1058(-)
MAGRGGVAAQRGVRPGGDRRRLLTPASRSPSKATPAQPAAQLGRAHTQSKAHCVSAAARPPFRFSGHPAQELAAMSLSAGAGSAVRPRTSGGSLLARPFPRPTAPAAAPRTSRVRLPGALPAGLRLSAARRTPTSECEAMVAFAGGRMDGAADSVLIDKAVATLRSAAPPNKSVPRTDVEGAMAYLESARESAVGIPALSLKGDKLLAELAGDWRLHFSTFSDTFPYLPLREVVRLDVNAKTIAVINFFGPVSLSFVSDILFSGTNCEFGFQACEVELAGRLVARRPLAQRNMKWYNFFYTDNGLACVRSSSGALTLLFRE